MPLEAQEIRVVRLETQFERFISDAESEKETRKRANVEIMSCLEAIEKRVRRLEWLVSGAVGGLATVEILFRLFKSVP